MNVRATVLTGALLAGFGGETLPGLAAGDELPAVALEPLTEGLPELTSVVSAGDDRLFLPLLDGRILIYDRGVVRPEPFLDLRSLVTWGDERGLLSVAFHPQYAASGFFFVYYTDTGGRPVLARYRVSSDLDAADPASAAVLLHLEHPTASHFGGQLQFGHEGHLYVGIGDGGDHYDPWCSAQRLDQLHGKILRLDVDAAPDAVPFYAIPSTNPWSGDAGARGEIWALGLRNPWRFSFDRATGDLYIGDVGESTREEVNWQPASSRGGENYGWARYEGTACIDRVASCPSPVPPCGDPALVAPILEYPRSSRTCNAVMGGFVYRGSAIPGLRGAYLFGDYCTGAIRAARRGADGAWTSDELGVTAVPLTGFGEDAAGEIYVSTRHGVVSRLVGARQRYPRACSRDENTLCLGQGRFRVEARYVEPGAESRPARAVTLSEDTGYFWFLGRANVELVTKILDGCTTPLGTYWVFAAGLTNFDVTLTVTDLSTGATRRYHNAAGQAFPALQDTAAFACR